jgi:hypothetical protein
MNKVNIEVSKNIFTDFILSNEEMICVRGGDADEGPKTAVPPIAL